MMKLPYLLLPGLMLPAIVLAETAVDSGMLDSVIVTAHRAVPTSLPSEIPTTMEGITKEQVEQTVNATDSEDAIKYFPSLLVRKRYIGDYNHAVLSSRASGTGNSARSAVYADGILLSNYLGNGANYAPRWMLVTPEEIERVDVMYGPFSAAYPGNSVGAVVDYVTRMPTKLEAHAKVTYVVQPFELYNTDETYKAHQESASLGDRFGSFSFWLNLNHTNSHGQPLTFPNKLLDTRPINAALPGDPVATGAVSGLNRSNQPWYIIGTATEYTTIQDHAKLKLAYEFTPTLRASYVLGYWQNDSEGRPQSYLRNTNGDLIYTTFTGANNTNIPVNIDGYRYTVAPTDFNLSNEDLVHVMHGLSFKSHTEGTWDYEVAASLYDYAKDELRAATVALPTAASGGNGTITDQDGTGWNTLALKGIWRPTGIDGAHIVDFGVQRDSYKLRILKSSLSNWISGKPDGADTVTDVGGKTSLQSVYAQDAWSFARDWKTVLGLRLEQWRAHDGYTISSSNTADPRHPYASRKASYVSPKAAIAYQFSATTAVKASVGRAVRMPTVNELYGATSGGAFETINDPNLRPEKSWTGELSLEHEFNRASLRVTGFHEVVKDSLYSERTAVGNTIVSRVTNVGKITTPGIELSISSKDLLISGLDITASGTWANSRIKENNGYVTVPGDTINKYQPRVPVWRATGLINYRVTQALNIAYGVRYSGKQYSTLDNSDMNGAAYQGSSRYLTTDLRVRYRFARQWTAALGVDNLNNYQYWNFHPYPQRSYSAELKWDL
jgi:iron complex outermembrane recepter protein